MNMADVQALGTVLAGNIAPSGTWYHGSTKQVVINALENFIRHDIFVRVRLFYGDTATGVAWPEENDVVGYVSRSTGPRKSPILVHNNRSAGGSAILDHCIVAIVEGNIWRYRHPQFSVGDWTTTGEPDANGRIWVYHNGAKHASGFKSALAAKRYIAFMRGERMGR